MAVSLVCSWIGLDTGQVIAGGWVNRECSDGRLAKRISVDRSNICARSRYTAMDAAWTDELAEAEPYLSSLDIVARHSRYSFRRFAFEFPPSFSYVENSTRQGCFGIGTGSQESQYIAISLRNSTIYGVDHSHNRSWFLQATNGATSKDSSVTKVTM